MRYRQFYPGDKVITIVDYEGVPSGSVGEVISKWAGTAYSVRLPNGTFRWLDSSEFGSTDPNRNYALQEGDIGVLTSGEHQHDFAKVGDMFKVYKVAYDSDYYKVMMDGKPYWLSGFQLAPNI